MKCILAMDLGTTSNRVIAFDQQGQILCLKSQEFKQIFPQSAWVEHDPLEIWNTAKDCLQSVVSQVGAQNIAGMGLTNQRETTVIWRRSNGQPIYNAIVWQCRRTADHCDALREHQSMIQSKTGLFLDPYFSATKIAWILEHTDSLQAAHNGDLCFGTIDSWILYKLTGAHLTEPSNASRTMLYNIHQAQYDQDLLNLFKVPAAMLPQVNNSADDFGLTSKTQLGFEIPIAAVLGDQQASFYAHSALDSHGLKNTYGTGLFLVAGTGSNIPDSGKLINTVALSEQNRLTYAMEGSVFIGGSVIQWLRDSLDLLEQASDSQALAESLDSNDGVYFVPALSGLGAPHWDADARGMMIGLTRATSKAHLIRAALESLAYQSRDVFEEFCALDPQFCPKEMRVDGGATNNAWLMQFQADILGCDVALPKISESTALGAAALAAVHLNFWRKEDLLEINPTVKIFKPQMERSVADKLYGRWRDALKRSQAWQH